ncbi:hypothetical protein [Halomonas sp. AOP43-D1-4]|uniref:hypothetical protein n=1 Tax=Halomonas sp. AOP43-D1-4 TaxID=3457658 RepID=UPI0040346F3C
MLCCEPSDLQHADYVLNTPDDVKRAVKDFDQAMKQNAPLPSEGPAILAMPLANMIAMPKPKGKRSPTKEAPSLLVLHESQLKPIEKLLEESLSLLNDF